MKVVAINGSPHKDGNTACSIQIVFDELEKVGIETEMISLAGKPWHSCTACEKCLRNYGTCAMGDDGLNTIIEKVREADGLILGSPVHYSGISGAMKCVCDRLARVAGTDASIMRQKVGAALVAVRRTGGSTALDCLNHYLSYHEMIVAASNYWNVTHGTKAGEVMQDEEGVQIMRVLGKNMAWLLSLRQQKIMQAPEKEKKTMTNFIR